MKPSRLLNPLLIGALICAIPASKGESPEDKSLDVLKMETVPSGLYDVRLQLNGESQSVRYRIDGNRAASKAGAFSALHQVSGSFELIGNGVFLARFAGKRYQATQFWVFQPDGTARVKEIPDRGEKQTAKRAKD